MSSSTDRIERTITVPVSRSRLWRAITNVEEFNAWFGVALESPLVEHAVVSGNITIADYTHLRMTIHVDAVEPERRFAFRWHPNAIDQTVDYSREPMTLVTFTLDEVEAGTRLTIVESGFDALPASRRIAAFESNSAGWAAQLENIAAYVSARVASPS